jgi:hypothetical protein
MGGRGMAMHACRAVPRLPRSQQPSGDLSMLLLPTPRPHPPAPVAGTASRAGCTSMKRLRRTCDATHPTALTLTAPAPAHPPPQAAAQRTAAAAARPAAAATARASWRPSRVGLMVWSQVGAVKRLGGWNAWASPIVPAVHPCQPHKQLGHALNRRASMCPRLRCSGEGGCSGEGPGGRQQRAGLGASLGRALPHAGGAALQAQPAHPAV